MTPGDIVQITDKETGEVRHGIFLDDRGDGYLEIAFYTGNVPREDVEVVPTEAVAA